MEKLTDSEIEVLAKVVESFEHPGSPTFEEEFIEKVTSLTSISREAAEFLFEHMLAIDPPTRAAMHFHHKEFVAEVLDKFPENSVQ